MSDRSDIDLAKSRLPLEEFLDRVAPNWRKNNPIRPSDKTNSFKVKDGFWKDFGQQDVGGDHIDFLKFRDGMTIKDAIHRVLEMANVSPSEKYQNGVHSIPKKEVKSEPKKPFIVDWPACCQLIDTEQLSMDRGYSMGFCRWLKDNLHIGLWDGQYAFPVHDASGKVIGVHHKTLIPNIPWMTKGGESRPFIIGSIIAKQFIVFESQWDAFAAMQELGFHTPGYAPDTTVLITRSSSNGKFTEIIPGGATAWIIMQNDQPDEKTGNIASDGWLSAIKKQCTAKLKVCRPPLDLKDFNEWLIRGDCDIHAMMAAAKTTGPQVIPITDIACDTSNDPDELLKRRFLSRKGGAMLNGPTGIGKSSLILQAAVSWALGRPFFAIEPVRPLTSLIVQAENDDGDLVEQREGVFFALKLTEEEKIIIRKRVLIHSNNSKTGSEFVSEVLRPLLREHTPDLLWLDNLFAYCGCAVSDQEKMTLFLRTEINPLIHEFPCGCIIAHHTNKPPSGEQKGEWSDSQTAYLGSGSGELANWPRAILSLRALKDPGVFELVAGKRGSRLGWKDAENNPTCRTLIAHSNDGRIYWRDAEPSDVPERGGRSKKYTVDDILKYLATNHLNASEWQIICKEEGGISKRTFYTLKEEAAEAGRIARNSVSKWFRAV